MSQQYESKTVGDNVYGFENVGWKTTNSYGVFRESDGWLHMFFPTFSEAEKVCLDLTNAFPDDKFVITSVLSRYYGADWIKKINN